MLKSLSAAIKAERMFLSSAPISIEREANPSCHKDVKIG